MHCSIPEKQAGQMNDVDKGLGYASREQDILSLLYRRQTTVDVGRDGGDEEDESCKEDAFERKKSERAKNLFLDKSLMFLSLFLSVLPLKKLFWS